MLLLSIQPVYGEMILHGQKDVELRRRVPRCSPGDEILLYASRSIGAIVGRVTCEDIWTDSPARLWRRVRTRCGITKRVFDDYFDDTEKAVGIVVSRPVRLENPVPLKCLRDHWQGFHPPQSFRLVSDGEAIEIEKLIARGRRKKAA